MIKLPKLKKPQQPLAGKSFVDAQLDYDNAKAALRLSEERTAELKALVETSRIAYIRASNRRLKTNHRVKTGGKVPGTRFFA